MTRIAWWRAALMIGATSALLVGCAAPERRPAPPAQVATQTPAPPTPAEPPAPAPALATESAQPFPTPTAPPPPPPPPPALPRVTLAPGLVVDRDAQRIEIEGTVPIDVRSGRTPRVYLEVLLCSRNTREHEAVVMTSVRASQVHAALLALGLEPGAPGSWSLEAGSGRVVPSAPTGPRVRVLVREASSPAGSDVPITDWVIDARDDRTRLADLPVGAPAYFVFAGSRFVVRGGAEIYAGDPEGTIVGLTAFGTETVAWTSMYHPDSAVETPRWIADPARLPAFGTPVIVTITPAD